MVPSNSSTDGILTFLEQGASMISWLKGVAKVGNNPFQEEPPTPSTGGGGLTSISIGELLCFNIASCPRPPLGLNRSERGWVVGGMQVSVWALLIDCLGEWALLLECSLYERRECEDSSYSSHHATPLLLGAWGVVMDLRVPCSPESFGGAG